MTTFLFAGSENAPVTILLAHGAGAPMDSDWMNAFCGLLAEEGVRSARFEFAYMAARREGRRRPPPKAETLRDEFVAAVDALGAPGPVLIGGKSMGGRVASLVADELHAAGRVAGLVCLGYPFHPPGRPEKLRTDHLRHLALPALICQGERDPFGTRAEVASYDLAPGIAIAWLADGDHDFRPRKPLTFKENMKLAARVAAEFATAADPAAVAG